MVSNRNDVVEVRYYRDHLIESGIPYVTYGEYRSQHAVSAKTISRTWITNNSEIRQIDHQGEVTSRLRWRPDK
ncbi:hypothetical protein KI387_029800, partial [Taxus chinensis]